MINKLRVPVCCVYLEAQPLNHLVLCVYHYVFCSFCAFCVLSLAQVLSCLKTFHAPVIYSAVLHHPGDIHVETDLDDCHRFIAGLQVVGVG